MGGIEMPNLGGWYPQMVFETITNERGNEIYIAVEDGLKGVHIVIRGPESEATNTITKLEAEALLRCLSDALLRHSQPSPPSDVVERAGSLVTSIASCGEPCKVMDERSCGCFRELSAALAAGVAGEWRPIESAPNNATEVILKVPCEKNSKGYRTVIGHWAQDLSGEEQPPFRGWFRDTGYHMAAIEPEPTEWMPLPSPPPVKG
jgi:hypothetical protein